MATEVMRFVSSVDEVDVGKEGEALLRHDRISGSRFLRDNCRGDQPVAGRSGSPPLSRHLVVSSRNEMPARPRREVAQDGGFNVDAGNHDEGVLVNDLRLRGCSGRQRPS